MITQTQSARKDDTTNFAVVVEPLVSVMKDHLIAQLKIELPVVSDSALTVQDVLQPTRRLPETLNQPAINVLSGLIQSINQQLKPMEDYIGLSLTVDLTDPATRRLTYEIYRDRGSMSWQPPVAPAATAPDAPSDAETPVLDGEVLPPA